MTKLFADFETQSFPVDACTIQNSRESEVFDSDELYLCVLVSNRWPNECKMEHMRPYIAKDGHKMLYGWVSIETTRPIMHVENPVWPDATRVVAWKKVEEMTEFGPTAWPAEEESDVDQPDQAND